jgi:hypothetical protein
MVRLDVRRASREKDAVEAPHELVQLQLLAENGNQQGKRIRRLEHGAGIFLPDHVKRMQADRASIGRNTNEWTSGCHDDCRAVFSILNKPAQRILQIDPY